MYDTVLLLTAAFVAGALNAVAGGGSFLTLPALVFTGVPPVVANATGTVALLPGYAAGAWGFREDTQPPPGLSMPRLVLLSLIGGAAGAGLLLVTSNDMFSIIVPWLLLAATLLFALGPKLREWTAGGKPSTAKANSLSCTRTTTASYASKGLSASTAKPVTSASRKARKMRLL